MPKTDNLVLIHGGWHDGRAWTATIAHLHAAGFDAVWAPTLLGHGPHTPRAVTYAQTVDHLVAWIEAHDLQDVVLVGHSFGGALITSAAAALPHRIARTVYLSALIPQDGQSIQDDTAAGAPRIDLSGMYNPEDNTLTMTWDVWRQFLPDASEEVARAAFAMLSPEAAGLQTDPIRLPAVHKQIPQSVITLEDDTLLPWASYTSRLPNIDRQASIPGSHEVMFSNPQALAGAITRVV